MTDILKKYQLSIPAKINEKMPVLLTDDQQDLRMIVAHQLSKRNFKNILYSSEATETIDVLKKNQNISVMVCNGDLSSLKGTDLLNEIREDPDIGRPPFCMSMTNVDKPKLLLAVEAGVDEILVKPFTLGDILPKIYRAFSIFHNPKNPEKLYELAKKKYRDQDFDAASEIYTYLHQSSPVSARPLNGLARIAHAKNETEKAFEFLQKAENANPHFVNTYSLKGHMLLDQGDMEKGLACFHKAFKASPINPVHYRSCAEKLLEMQQFDMMATVLDLAIKNKVQFPGIYHLLSQSAYRLKNYPDCIKYIQKEIIRDPQNITYLNQLALSYKESENFEDATKTYNKVIKIDPSNKQALFNKAIMLSQTGKEKEAVKILKRMLEIYPDFERAKTKIKELESG
ncbi:MAG: tetratricopeptide repeat protein [Deltaproteobacteria bacterium]|nr:tetratricopeptide repeat protein [Deltaproteobacteria bacterium]